MNIRSSPSNVMAAAVSVAATAIAIWQFYAFVTFTDSLGLVDVHGGTNHLWWAIVAAFLACLAGFFLFSVSARYDKTDEMHITS